MRPVLSSVSVEGHPFAGQGWAAAVPHRLIVQKPIRLMQIDQNELIKMAGERSLNQGLLSAHLCRRKETNFDIVGCVNHFSIDGDSSVGDRHDELSFDQAFDIDLIGY